MLRRVPAGDQRACDLQRGDDVTARPAARDHRAPPCAHRPRAGPGGPAGRLGDPQRATGLALPGDVDQDAGRHHGDDERRTTEGDERQRDAGDRQHAHHRPDVDERLRRHPGHQPEARAARRSGRATASRPGCPSQMKAPRRARTNRAPTMPSCSPMTEKMKSVCALGRKPHCAWPPPRPAPTRWPDPRPISDCMHLVARARAVGRRVDEREQPGPAVRARRPPRSGRGRPGRPSPS